VAVCALAILLELLLDSVTGDPVSPFLPAFAAIIASAAWGGLGPGLVTTFLLVNWSAFRMSRQAIAVSDISLRCLIFAAEGVLLSFGSSRMWRSIRDAAQSETWHRRLVETASEGIWVHDELGVIRYANARMAQILGVTLETLIGRNIDEFFFPADLSVERVRAASLRNGRKEQFDRRLRRADGAEIWVLTCCNIMSVDAEISGALSMMTDITERKRAESALRISEERFRTLFESVREGVYQTTPEGRFLAANPMLMQILGIKSEAELKDIDIARDLFIDPNVHPRVAAQLEREGSLQHVEHELRRRDGQIITVTGSAHVVRDENGKVLYYEGTVTDITPRKRMEEQLREAQKMEALGHLAGSVADDFSNVLTIVTGCSQIALSQLPPQHPARASIDQILRAAAGAMSVTRQLVSFSRSQAPAGGSLDLNDAVKRSEAAGQWNPVLSLSADPVPVYATQMRVELILRRLSEAVRIHFPSDHLEWKIRVANLEAEFGGNRPGVQPGRWAVLSIGTLAARTNGPGELPDPSADPSFMVMKGAESAAMGLAETHATVAQCDGFILTRAGGSIFHVFLPWATAAENSSADTEHRGETILLVEDEPLLQELSRDMLERQGYHVILASNAKDAERIGASGRNFDLLITDTSMPDITGAELARRLRADHPGLKVLFISGYADRPLSQDLDGEEGAAVIERPFSADALGRRIRQILSDNEARSAGI
jgi:PAS domain S-box-containing protein